MQDLDDKIQNLQAMKNYPDISPKMKKRSTELCKDLERFAEVIDFWVKFQKNWMSLEPVFTSDDIKQQLGEEAKKFEHHNR